MPLLLMCAVVMALTGAVVAQPDGEDAADPVPPEERARVTLRFVVTVPPDTPNGDAIYLCGDDPALGNWDAAAGLELNPRGGNVYHATVRLARGAHVRFKVTRGSWATVEKDELGGEIENRYAIADDDKDVPVVVASWAIAAAKPAQPTLTGDIRRHPGFQSDILNNKRTLLVYLPPGYESETDRRYPVLYMQDGQNIFDASTSFAGVEWGVDEAAERLIAAGTIEPIIIVAIYNNTDRLTEYTPRPVGEGGDAYARFVVEEVKPFIDRMYRTDPSREKTGVAGSSLGGLISLYMVWAHAETFGRCGAVSPSLWWRDRWLIRQWGRSDFAWAAGARIWLDMGTAEGRAEPGEDEPSHITNAREVAQMLDRAGLGRGRGYEYLEIEGGRHNEEAWAARVDHILTFLYGQ
jgi:predicted alpha/beta superfamily hydrolase